MLFVKFEHNITPLHPWGRWCWGNSTWTGRFLGLGQKTKVKSTHLDCQPFVAASNRAALLWLFFLFGCLLQCSFTGRSGREHGQEQCQSLSCKELHVVVLSLQVLCMGKNTATKKDKCEVDDGCESKGWKNGVCGVWLLLVNVDPDL